MLKIDQQQMIALAVVLIPYALMTIDMIIGRIRLAYLRREARCNAQST